jgi:hypothetical protein
MASKPKTLDSIFTLLKISAKRVFVVDDHHKALAAWALLRREIGEPFVLVTLDHHPDTDDAFHGAAWKKAPNNAEKQDVIRAELVAALKWEDDAAVLSAVANLRYDEHIDAAARAGILRAAFCIQHMDADGWPKSHEQIADSEARFGSFPPNHALPHPQRPFTYAAPENRVFTVPDEQWMDCAEADDGEEPRLYNDVLERRYLDEQLARASEMSKSVGLDSPRAAPYVLDIDLDVFHTVRSITPEDASTFYDLIRGALAVTVATEAECVAELWRDPKIKPGDAKLLDRLLAHVAAAQPID